jgi:hypothetical protein
MSSDEEAAAAMAREMIERYLLSHPPNDQLYFPTMLRQQIAACPLCVRDDDGQPEQACAFHLGVILGLAMAHDEQPHHQQPAARRRH